MKKIKRKYVYCQNPTVYDVGPCIKCGNNNITWSEYEDLLWCYDCEVDFKPEHWGIFDGPIPMRMALMMGISFDRIDILTGKLIPFTMNFKPYVEIDEQSEWDKTFKHTLLRINGIIYYSIININFSIFNE